MTQLIATHIEIRQNRDGQDRAFIEGTRVRVQDVAVLAEVHGRTPDQIAEALPHLSLAQIHAALSYYFGHRPEFRGNCRKTPISSSEAKPWRDPARWSSV